MSLLEENIISEPVKKAVKEMGFEQFTPIQEQAIPVLTEGKDMLGQAQTGTGKTAAFGIPLIQKMDPENEHVQGIVLCPTRELAIQAAEEMRKFAKYTQGVKILPIYGGQDISKQIRSLHSKVSIVVGTPGRVMDHIRRHTLKLQDINMLVLDEADEMLSMGFREDIETILKSMPTEHQTALFSATMPKSILEIINTYLNKDAVTVKVTPKEITIPLVKQYYYEVNSKNKEDVSARLLDYYNPKRSLIFCNTKRMVDQLCDNLKGRGYFAEGLHGDLSQFQRDKVMNNFRNGTVEILIATDVAARGIDVDDVEAVINYDIPQDIEYYVHRIGRTGRAGKKGRAFTLVVGREIYKIRDIERACKTKMKARKVPSVKDVTAAKSDNVFTEVLKTVENEDLTMMLRLVEEKLEECDCTAMDLAAAFLKMQMGTEPEEIIIERYGSRNRRSYGDNNDRRGGGRREYRGNDRNNDRRRDGDFKKRDKKRDGDYYEHKKDRYKDKSFDDEKSGEKKKFDRKNDGGRKPFRKDGRKGNSFGKDKRYRDENDNPYKNANSWGDSSKKKKKKDDKKSPFKKEKRTKEN